MLFRKNCLGLYFALVLSLLLPVSTWASGVSPYLPLNMSPEAERQVERLLALSGTPVLTRPIPVAVVHKAAQAYCTQSSMLCRQVKSYLKRFAQADSFTYANLAVSYTDREDNSGAPTLPNQRGQRVDNAATINAQLYVRMSPNWYAFLGGERREDGESMEGTYSSFGWEWMQLDVGYRPHWLSPMKSRSMLWSANAETTPSVSVSNPVSIGGIGFRYEVFATKLSRSNNIVDQGNLISGSPCAVGMHLSITPIPALALGLNRVAMYGGGAKGKCYNPGKFFDAVLDPKSNDREVPTGVSEFGTQLISLNSRVNLRSPVPVSLYIEYDGEGASKDGGFKLDDTAKHIGVYFPALFPEIDLRLEYSTWSSGWYQNPIYRDGLSNSGHAIGLSDIDQVGLAADADGNAIYMEAAWQHQAGRLFQAALQTASYDSTLADYSDSYEIKSRYSFAWKDRVWGVEGGVGRSADDERYSRIGMFVRW